MSRRKPKSRRYHEAYVRLNAAFPLAFPLDDADLRPLALSTREDLRAWIDTQHIERAQASVLLSVMQQHCCRLTYQQVVAAGGMRITLHGEPVEPVTPEGQAHAQGRMTAILAARAAAKERRNTSTRSTNSVRLRSRRFTVKKYVPPGTQARR